MSDREPGWYWVKVYGVEEPWEPAELKPSDYDDGFRWHHSAGVSSEHFPAVIGPRIYSPDDVVTRYPGGETK